MSNTTTTDTIMAISVHPAVALYVRWREALGPAEALPLHRCSPIAIFLQSQLVPEAIFSVAPTVPNLVELYPASLRYSVPPSLADRGYLFLPEQAQEAFNHFVFATMADDASFVGRILRPLRVDLRRIIQTLHTVAELEDHYVLDNLLQREQRLRIGDRKLIYIEHRNRRVASTHRVRRKAVREVLPELF